MSSHSRAQAADPSGVRLASLTTDQLVGLLRDVQHELDARRGPVEIEPSVLFAVAVRHWHPTPRQCQVLRGLLDGLSNKEIGALHGCSHRTVEIHVGALLQKAAVDTRARLVAKARMLAAGVGAHPKSDTVMRR